MARRQAPVRALIWTAIAVVVGVGGMRAASPPPATLLASPSRGELHVEAEARGNYVVGDYTISLAEGSMSVLHPQAFADVWSSPAGEGFLSAASATTTITNTGSLARVIESWKGEMSEQTITRARVDSQGDLWIYGDLSQPQEQGSEQIKWHARWCENKETGTLEVTIQVPSSKINRVAFSTKLDSDEHFYGGGLTYTQPDRKVILVMPRFQGTGRGDQPLTLIEDLITGQGGSQETSQAPLARITTDAPRTQWVRGKDPVVVDGRQNGRVSMTSWSNSMTITFANRRTPAEQVGQMVQTTGPMQLAPTWATDGLVITDPGTSVEGVLTNVERWANAGLTPKAVLIRSLPSQDGGAALRDALHQRGIRLITTLRVGDPVKHLNVDGILIEGAERFIQNADYQNQLDEWVAQLRPLLDGIDEPLIMSQGIVDGYTDKPMMINVGNLNANFSMNDGLPTAVSTMINAGISGLAFSNVTVGGDVTIDRPFWLGGVKRSEEHIARSAQLAVFSAMFRTGLDDPNGGVQMYNSAQAQAQISRWLMLRRALTPIRNRLNEQAVRDGIPPVREPMLVQPDDRDFDPDNQAFFYGDDLYVVPVVTPGQTEMEVELPQGNWRNVWTGETHLVRRGERLTLTVPTPLDQFPLFSRVNTSTDHVLTQWAKQHEPSRPVDSTAAGTATNDVSPGDN